MAIKYYTDEQLAALISGYVTQLKEKDDLIMHLNLKLTACENALEAIRTDKFKDLDVLVELRNNAK
jgi:hypothetical protein